MAKAKKDVANSKADADDTPDAMPSIERWINEIDEGKDLHQPWWDKCDKIVERYIDQREDETEKKRSGTRRYNALWSLMQTLIPLTYSTPPKPYVSRRFNDSDKVARNASLILQRNLSYDVDSEKMHDALEDSNEDFNLTSRGVIWFRYSPLFNLRESEEKTYVTDPKEAPEGAELLKEDDKQYFKKKYEEKVDDDMDIDHVYYKDLIHGPASKWGHVPWIARRVPMTRVELIKRFGKEKGSKPPLTLQCSVKSKGDSPDSEKGMFAKAEIWELWDKTSRTVFWICPQWKDDFLDTKKDPLELAGFFPCPRPAYGTKTNKSIIPQPDFLLWQDIAIELDDITKRIKLLTSALRVVGIYDSSSGDKMKRIVTHTDDNDMIPVDNWAMFQEKGGLKGAVEFLPIDQVMMVLDKLSMRRQALVQELYEITGVSDIIRGSSDPNETLGAQQLKGNYANKRLGKRQDKLARMAREGLEIMAQIICTQYSDERLLRASSAEEFIKLPDGRFDEKGFADAVALLRSSLLRQFRVKIDERSLAAQDLSEDREERLMFIQSVSQFLTAAVPMATAMPASKGLLGELLMFGVRAFPLARTTEAKLEEAMEQLMNAPPPPPEAEAAAAGPAGKSPEELSIEAQKVAVQQRRVDAMFEQIQRQREDDHRKYDLALRELQQNLEESQRKLQIAETKIYADFTTKDNQTNATRESMQHSHQIEERRHERDLSNDRVSAVQAFAAPRPTGARRAA